MADRISLLIEDPVEYRFKSINQVQVNPRAGLTFANGLRSILRLDPNVILVGEIRDAVTIALDSLERQGSEVNQNLRVVTNILPSTVSLTGISYAGDKMDRKQPVTEPDRGFLICRELKCQHRFSEVIIASIKKIRDEGADFILVLKTRG